ncbi:hypothetical protein STAQ_20250 [Allostella sp. ATCC 35155]|nr:hypothetical protein STAQ_20250 [Stella sp. ATCC 35155]
MSFRTGNILNVDDNEAARYARTRVLRREGYSVDEAGDGATAWDMVCRRQPDIVVLDVRLPDVSGLEVCRRIKARFPTVMVLQTSASLTGGRDRAQGLESGADSYLIAPIEPEELLATVAALMRLHAAEEALRRSNEELEARVDMRTSELAEANRRLRVEIEERERAEAHLRQAQKIEALGQLTGGIAHDFNNLLTVILGGIELARDRTSDERSQRLLANAAEAGYQAARLTEQLLSFARRQHFERRKLAPGRLLRRLEDFLRQTIGSLYRLEIVLPEEDWFTVTDRGQFEALIVNLLINARDAMPDGGPIRILVENLSAEAPRPGLLKGELLAISVSDRGVGMTEAVRARAFDPFFTTKPAGRGSGLGLSMVHGVTIQSGGEIAIDSEVGCGTTVRLHLPRVAVSPDEAAIDLDDRRPPASRPPPITALLVEDNDSVREYTATVLAGEGHGVRVFPDGPSALAAVAEGAEYDLAIVDYAMPNMTGAELAAELRRLRPGRPILVLTGYADAGALQRLALDHVVVKKPYSLMELRAGMSAALSRRA